MLYCTCGKSTPGIPRRYNQWHFHIHTRSQIYPHRERPSSDLYIFADMGEMTMAMAQSGAPPWQQNTYLHNTRYPYTNTHTRVCSLNSSRVFEMHDGMIVLDIFQFSLPQSYTTTTTKRNIDFFYYSCFCLMARCEK